MTIRKALIQNNGDIAECPSTDTIPLNIPTTANAPTGNGVAWVEDVDGTGEGYLTLGGIGMLSSPYDEQMTLFARNSSGVLFALPMKKV